MNARSPSEVRPSGLIDRHRLAVPAILGVLSGLLLGPVVVGSAFPGYMVGRAGAGSRICAAGLFVGLAAIEGVALTAQTGCLGCVDTLVVVARVYAALLIPFAIGWLIGRWARQRGFSADQRLNDVIVRHRLAAPAILGVLSGLLFGPVLLGAAVPGYLVGKAGAGKWICAAGLFVGFAVTTVGMVNAMVGSGCPSCVDAMIMAPVAYVFLLIPFGIGCLLGQAAARRSAVPVVVLS
jgi:hypothetical protein